MDPNEATLAGLLSQWRQTRDPSLEAPIAKLGRDVARARGGLVTRSKAALEKQWLALARKKDPGDVDRLLDAPWPGAWKVALTRVKALGRLPADPRIAAKLARLASSYDSWASWPLHREIAATRLRAPTGAVLAGLEAVEAARSQSDVPAHGTREIYAKVRAAVAGLAPVAPLASQPEPHAPGADKPELQTLWARLAQHPGDLALRAVLGDALQAAGDPRGELIALQLALANGGGGAPARKRTAQLLAAHLDPLSPPHARLRPPTPRSQSAG